MVYSGKSYTDKVAFYIEMPPVFYNVYCFKDTSFPLWVDKYLEMLEPSWVVFASILSFEINHPPNCNFSIFLLICDLVLHLIDYAWLMYHQLISPLCCIHASVNWIIVGSSNGLGPLPHQPITWTNAALLSIGFLGTNFGEIWIL